MNTENSIHPTGHISGQNKRPRLISNMTQKSVKTLMTGLLLFQVTATATVAQKSAQKPDQQQLPKPDYNREVRPILSQHCFKCHGPDDGQRQAKLRLDRADGATALLSGGHRAVVPGKPQSSTLVQRILSHGADIMPPAYANKPLSDTEKATLQRWIASGAEYQPHWAFVAPKAAPLPKVKQTTWPRNPIDHFTLARMEKAGLHPSPPADRYTLVRRVYLDLIGLPPTPAEANEFLNDKSPNAYEKLVDRLLASPHYGERWARRWLDLARYADTNGYEKDRPRSVWPYRDWVINALNQDMPFNQFTVEQLAGDLLPNATLSQRIATGFHRNTMLNEEGGIDPLEFRFYSMTDRVATTGTVWLGLTVACAQCHTHKFDPITQREYYRMMACLNNADELMADVPTPEVTAQRDSLLAQIKERESKLAQNFPVDTKLQWTTVPAPTIRTASGATVALLPDHSALIAGTDPETDTYIVQFDSDARSVGAVRLETLTDPSLGKGGPGRTPHGNFVLTEFSAKVTPNGTPSQPPITVHFSRAEADFSQEGFPAINALAGNPKAGWAVDGPGQSNKNRTATFYLDKTLALPNGGRWTITLGQQYGGHHTIGRLRLTLGQTDPTEKPQEARRQEILDSHFNTWLAQQRQSALHWHNLHPAKAASQVPVLSIQPDDSVFVSGDMTKRDVYDLAFRNVASAALNGKPITAIRLEALPDDRLPKHGPGRVFYEGALGDFFLSEIEMRADGAQVAFSGATQSNGSSAQAALDGDPQTGWTVNGHQGEVSTAIFHLKTPVAANSLDLSLIFERYFAAGMGRFRIAVTSDPLPATLQAPLPPEIERSVLLPTAQQTPAQRESLKRYYLTVAPELQSEREAIAQLRRQLPDYPTALIFQERPADNPRATHVHHRGEWLQPKEQVTPGVLAILPPLPANAPANRLTFARWITAPDNPLVGRVTVNRQWAAFFGRGIVRTTEDFGYQGEPPTNPELLDWLAATFTGRLVNPSIRPWSFKSLQRLIVTSATYRQASRVTPELLTKDPENLLLARGPRVRLEAELVRDYALTVSGLLSPKIGGPSVFPPQPPGVTSEGTYGPLAWNVSPGEDRYRRGLYTFSKRTAPYAMFTTFDAPTGEVCVARRDSSNTPLQALTLLNDQVFTEAAQTLGKQFAALHDTDQERMTALFRRCLTRTPSQQEIDLLLRFYAQQKARFESKALDAAAVAGTSDGDTAQRAAWTTVARSLLNLDETVTKR